MNVKYKVRGESWKNQRECKKEDIPTQEQIYQSVLNCFDTLQEQALFILVYLTGGRIREIVQSEFLFKRIYARKYKFDEKQGGNLSKIARNINGSPIIAYSEKIPDNYAGIRKRDITFNEIDNKPIMVVNLRTLKSRKQNRRNIPVPIKYEKRFIDILMVYLNLLADESPLFDFGYRKARLKILKAGLNPHYLRDIRLTHMVQLYDLDAFRLTKFCGWADSRPANSYVQLSYRDIVSKY